MLPERYSYENFKTALREPNRFLHELGRISHPVQNRYYNLTKWEGGVQVTEEDWDNLIILDACRADLFENIASVERFDSYERKESIDSNTTPWTKKNFGGGEFGDIVYVTANPVTSKVAPEAFHELIEVWNDEEVYDEETYSIPPEPVIEYAREASREFPNKRLIIHFVQPHYPFIPRPDLIYTTSWDDAEEAGADFDGDKEPPNSVWSALRLGEVSKEECWDGYRSNLEFMLSDVTELAEELPGKSIISSDHGNMVGERILPGFRVYGHPGGLRCSELLEVPWAVIDSEERKDIIDEGTESEGSTDSEVIEDRLNALGYVE
jgi:hypothetical protein